MSTENPNAIGITAVAVTKENDEGELYLNWLLEGGIAELEHPGVVLLATDVARLTNDDGHGEVYTLPQPASGRAQDAWRPMDSAPKDGSLLRLLVEFDDCAIDDGEGPFATVGQNFMDTTGEDAWQFVGWDWEQDCFVDGVGRPVGWMPMLAASPQPAAQGEFSDAYQGAREDLAIWKRRALEAEEQLRRIVGGETGAHWLAKLDNGQGSDTDDGKNWLAARAFLANASISVQLSYMAGAPLLSTAAQDVLAERNRQINAEGYDASHDDMATNGQIAVAAGYYALICGWPHERDISLIQGGRQPQYWPWAAEYWKPSTPRRNLVKAGALILAEIERLDRAAAKAGQQEQQP
jgi:hypothetical protein